MNLFFLIFTKKLIENKNIYKLIKKFPNINAIGNVASNVR